MREIQRAGRKRLDELYESTAEADSNRGDSFFCHKFAETPCGHVVLSSPRPRSRLQLRLTALARRTVSDCRDVRKTDEVNSEIVPRLIGRMACSRHIRARRNDTGSGVNAHGADAFGARSIKRRICCHFRASARNSLLRQPSCPVLHHQPTFAAGVGDNRRTQP